MLPVIGFVLFFIQARYIVPLIPVFILWSVRGVLQVGDWLVGTAMALRQPSPSQKEPAGEPGRAYHSISRHWRAIMEYAPLALVLVGLIALQPIVKDQVLDVGSVRPEHKTVGQYLGLIVPHDEVIMARYPAIAFHADTKWVPTPNASWPEVLRYARHKGVRYFALDERELRYRPQFQDLIAQGAAPPELRPIYQSEVDGERLVVYELLEATP